MTWDWHPDQIIMDTIQYKINSKITAQQFVDILHRSGLAERRPVDNQACIEGMINNSNLVVTAWDKQKLIGVARSMTDYHYACYLSDLAVDKAYQKCGIGKQLQLHTQQQLGPECKLILIAAPDANDYYPHIGFSHVERCWILDRKQTIR